MRKLLTAPLVNSFGHHSFISSLLPVRRFLKRQTDTSRPCSLLVADQEKQKPINRDPSKKKAARLNRKQKRRL